MSTEILDQLVLLLNVNFEPLNVCTTRRALSLLFTGKAETILNGRGYVHTSSKSFELPSIIRLSYMIKRPRPKIALSKREIFRRDNYTCQYCGRQTRILTIDHIVPRHLGGAHSWENLVTACQNCNRRKGGKVLWQTDMRLLRAAPGAPPGSASYRFKRYLAQNSEWEPYVTGW